MDTKRTSETSSKTKIKNNDIKKPKNKEKSECAPSQSTSHTQYFRKDRYTDIYERITSQEYLGFSESISGSSDTFHCFHGPEGKRYSAKGQLKRNLLKELDPVPLDKKWYEEQPPVCEWELAGTIEFLVTDPVASQQYERLRSHIIDLSKIASNGFKINILDSLCIIIDYLVETESKTGIFREEIYMLFDKMDKPILLNAASDVLTHFEPLRRYLGFLGYLLMRIEEDELFDLVSRGIIFQLSACDRVRGHGAAQLRHTMSAAAPVLFQTTVRMIAVATAHRLPTYMEIAFLLACDNVENCIEMMMENIIENIFYRFNPYFPERKLPVYDINPADPHDVNVKLGDSSVNMNITLSLLLVLVKTTKHFLEENPNYIRRLPSPDTYSQRCYIWAYRYECRARERKHERISLTVLSTVLLHCFGDRLEAFSTDLMPDILSLSVQTELPLRNDWTRTVNFNISQLDVQFKKLLIHFSVVCLKIFKCNQFMVESQHWLLGLMYLLDPGLCYLRVKWSPALFAEIRKTALQAIVCTLPLAPRYLAKKYGLIRRMMWYIEWYSESPYELSVLYWCTRLLQVTIYTRDSPERQVSINDFFNTHGIIILIHLCVTLLEQKLPPVEKSQVIIALCLRMLTSAVEWQTRVTCCVYPRIKWPSSINSIARKMMDVVLYSLDKHYIINDRWLISLLNFIWEAIIWKNENRQIFISRNGIYQLLDLITMTSAPVQCVALALVCDVARAGDAVGQLVTWRANLSASNAYPVLVKRGATIASLLAAVFRDDCQLTGVPLNDYGVIQDLDNPLLSAAIKEEIRSPDFAEDKSKRTTVCLVAADLAGSRMSKAFTLLHLLSEDLKNRVMLADEAYNLYKNIKLAPEDEAILVLCSHYLTIKLNEVWIETQIQSQNLLPEDKGILTEFLHIGKGWANEIKRQQECVIEEDRKKKLEEEYSLYEFLARVRLNIALDALREVRCEARSADRVQMIHALLLDAVKAHHRRSVVTHEMSAPILKTYGPSLDDQNITGQNMKVYSIQARDKPKVRPDYPLSTSS